MSFARKVLLFPLPPSRVLDDVALPCVSSYLQPPHYCHLFVLERLSTEYKLSACPPPTQDSPLLATRTPSFPFLASGLSPSSAERHTAISKKKTKKDPPASTSVTSSSFLSIPFISRSSPTLTSGPMMSGTITKPTPSPGRLSSIHLPGRTFSPSPTSRSISVGDRFTAMVTFSTLVTRRSDGSGTVRCSREI
jgi:hypothetical protein